MRKPFDFSIGCSANPENQDSSSDYSSLNPRLLIATDKGAVIHIPQIPWHSLISCVSLVMRLENVSVKMNPWVLGNLVSFGSVSNKAMRSGNPP